MSGSSDSGCGTMLLVAIVLFSLSRACDSTDYDDQDPSYNAPTVESSEPPSTDGFEFHAMSARWTVAVTRRDTTGPNSATSMTKMIAEETPSLS